MAKNTNSILELLTSDSDSTHPKFEWVYYLVMVLVFCLSYNYVFDIKLDLNGDNANYFMLGKALSQGEGYVNIAEINKTPNNHFPPGYPVIIAAIISLFADSVFMVKLASGLFFFSSILVLYQIFKKVLKNQQLAFVAILFVAVNTHLLKYSTMIMSEVPFLFFSSLTLLLYMRASSMPKPLRSYHFYLSLLLLVVTYHIRTLGIAVFSSLILHMVYRKNWKGALIYTGGFVLLTIPWYVRVMQLGGNNYLKQLAMVNPYKPELGEVSFAGLVERVAINLKRYITYELPSGILPTLKIDYHQAPNMIHWVTGILLLGLLLLGLFRLKSFKVLITCYVISTFGILLLWPEVWVGLRFMLPLLPLFLVCAVNGLYHLSQIPWGLLNKSNQLSPLLLLIAGFVYVLGMVPLNDSARRGYPPAWANYFEIADWSKDNLNETDVIACRKPTMFYMFSSKPTTNYPYTSDDLELIKSLRQKGVKYVVVEQLGYNSTYDYLLPAVRKNPDKFTTVMKLPGPDTFLLKLEP